MKTRLLPLLLAAVAALTAATPQVAWARHGHGSPPPGRVVVTNHSGGTVTVTVSGQPGRVLPAWTTAEVYAPAGDVAVRSTYVQFGGERVLQSDRLFVPPGRTTALVLQPEDTARVLVTNDSPFRAQLFVDGGPGATFTPGEARVVSVSVGRHDLQLLADGRPLGRASMTLRAFEEPRWTVSPPRVGELLVQNPLPIPIQLVCEKGLVRTVSAYGTVAYKELSPGDFRLTARRLSGEFVDTLHASIRPGATSTERVDAPRTGLVALDSDHWLGVEVRLDGKRMTTLAPNAPYRLEAKVGWHEIEVIDERGRKILDTWVEFEPFDTNALAFGTARNTRAYDGYSYDDDRHDRDDRDHRDHRDDHRGHDHDRDDKGQSCSMH